jgi:hypothetical protein
MGSGFPRKPGQFGVPEGTRIEAFASPVEVKRQFDTISSLEPGAPVPIEQQEAALRWALNDFLVKANRNFEARGRPDLVLSFHEDFSQTEYNYANTYARAFFMGNRTSTGYAGYDDTVRAVVDALIHLISFDPAKPHVAFRAPMQSGKTGFMVMLALLLRLYHARLGRVSRVYFLPYASVGPTEETKRDYAASLHLYANLKIEGFTRTLSAINGGLLDEEQFVKRNTQKNIRAMIQGMIKKAEKDGLQEVTLVIDEADHASGKKSVLGAAIRWLRELAVRDHPVRVRLVLVSATPYEFIEVEACYKIEIIKHPGGGYRGIVQGDPYHCHSWTDLAEHVGLRELDETFRIAKNGVAKSGIVARLIARLINGVDAPTLGLNGMPMNGGRVIAIRYGTSPETSALYDKLQKFCKTNRIAVTLHRHSGRRAVIAGRTIKTIDDVIKAVEGPIVIFVTGLARRSDRFDKECALFLDFTHRCTSAEAFYQGFIGRASGYKAENVAVFVSDKNMETVAKTRRFFLDHGVDVPQIASSRAIRVGADGKAVRRPRAIEKTNFAFLIRDLHAFDPEFCEGLVERVMNSIGGRVRSYDVIRRNGEPGIRVRLLRPNECECPPLARVVPSLRGKDQFRFDLATVLGGSEGWSVLERFASKHLGNPVELLNTETYQETSKSKTRKYNSDGGFINVAVGNFRRNETGDHQGGGSTTSRWDTAPPQRGMSNTSQKALLPEFMFTAVKDGKGNYTVELGSIFLHFARSALDESAFRRSDMASWKPREKSAYDLIANEDERRDAALTELMEKDITYA